MPKKIVIILTFVALTIITFLNFSKSQDEIQSNNIPKNIIIFIGDGMGTSQVTAGKTVKGTLNLERFKTLGLVTTHSKNKYVTDSAAGATAMSTGVKTSNGIIGQTPDGEPIKNAFEYAIEKDMATGLVSTCSVTHATPAGFVSHVAKRGMQNEIAEQVANFPLTVLFNSGWAYFIPKSAKDSKREDDKDLLSLMKQRMQLALTSEEYNQLDEDKPAAALLYPNHPPQAHERQISLAELTAKAIRILSKNKEGFILMVEGSQIDWGGHDNAPEYIIGEMVDFDDAIGAGMDFAEQDENTLVIVTADHETGGFSLQDGSIEEKTVTKALFTSGGHSGTMVPLFAYGPGSDTLAGIQDNTHIGKTIIQFIQL